MHIYSSFFSLDRQLIFSEYRYLWIKFQWSLIRAFVLISVIFFVLGDYYGSSLELYQVNIDNFSEFLLSVPTFVGSFGKYSAKDLKNSIIISSNGGWTTHTMRVPNLLISAQLLEVILTEFHSTLSPSLHHMILKVRYSSNETRSIGPMQQVDSNISVEDLVALYKTLFEEYYDHYSSFQIIELIISSSDTHSRGISRVTTPARSAQLVHNDNSRWF